MNMKVYLYNRISSKYYKIFPFGEMIESLNSHINMKHIFLCIREFKNTLITNFITGDIL